MDDIFKLTAHGSELLSKGILDVYFANLEESKVPTVQGFSAQAHELAKSAHAAIYSLAHLHLDDLMPYENLIVKAWPGLFKWSSFLYQYRVKSQSFPLQSRRYHMDVSCSPSLSDAEINSYTYRLSVAHLKTYLVAGLIGLVN